MTKIANTHTSRTALFHIEPNVGQFGVYNLTCDNEGCEFSELRPAVSIYLCKYRIFIFVPRCPLVKVYPFVNSHAVLYTNRHRNDVPHLLFELLLPEIQAISNATCTTGEC